jgi:hypothetical protein
MFAVSRGVDKGERAPAGSAPELRQARALITKLLDVAATELLEATRIMSEPLPELRARGQLLVPCVKLGLLA